MTQHEIERLVVIETKFETIVEPMAFKIDQIHDSMPEMNRKVNEHHNMYHALKDANCPNIKVMPDKRTSDGNGGYLERRTKKPLKQQFTEMPLGKKITSIVVIITFFGAFGEWILSKAHSIISLLESMFI